MIVNNHFVPRKGQSPRVISSCSMKETHNTSWTTADSSEPPCANDHRCSALSVAVHPQIALKELWIATTGHWQASCANNDHCTATGCWILTSTAFATLTAAHLYYKHPPYAFIANRNNHNHPSHALKIHYAFSDTQSTPQEDRVQELLKTTPNAALWPSGAYVHHPSSQRTFLPRMISTSSTAVRPHRKDTLPIHVCNKEEHPPTRETKEPWVHNQPFRRSTYTLRCLVTSSSRVKFRLLCSRTVSFAL